MSTAALSTSRPDSPATPPPAGTKPRTRRRTNEDNRGRWLWIAATYTLCGLLIIPIYWLLVTSIRQPAELQSAATLWPTNPNFAGYTDVVSDTSFARNLLNSLIYGLGGVVLGALLGSGIAYAVARSGARWSKGVVFAMLVLQTFPSSMLALPLFIMFSQMGLVNSPFAVILAIGTKTVPFTALMMRPYFASIPLAVEQAAALDGASGLTILSKIVMPLSLPGLITVSAFNFVTGWGDLLFSFTLLMDEKLQPVSVGLYRYMGQYGIDWNQLMAASAIAAIPTILVFFTSQRFLVSGTVAGATNE
jgi:multiple sugar transport system permease protein